MLTAPAGFLTLHDTATRFAERLRCSRQKAEYRVARAIAEGKLPLVAAETMELFTAAEGEPIDFAASEAMPAAGAVQVIHLHLAEDGGATTHVASGRIPVVLDADDVERVLDELAPAAVVPTSTPRYQPPVEPPQTATTERRLPGRPSEYDWPWYEAQARRRVYRHGLPEKSSIIVAELLALFGRKVRDNQPEQRTVERMVARWWPSLFTLSANIEELRGPCEITPASNSRPI